ncbi:MAG: biotin--[acetyl-CoA-carboxylase] ligase [Actinobacteria bacterium]|nr:biotin--[acetyl-CoA-carboxylase] ligase [Actinomycetota bacterium]
MTLGTPRLHLREVDSTNVRAQRLAVGGAPHGALVTAAAQTAGHGRQGRAWVTPPGRALACSLVLRDPPRLLPMVAALAVADVADRLDAAGRTAAIKWPNDVLLDGRKVAGILAEGRPQEGWVVLGIGLNVAVAQDGFPPELHALATSLDRAPADVETALALLLERLEHWLATAPADAIDAYRARDALAGREIAWNGGRGTALGIADDGRLRVRPGDDPTGEELLLDAGEVHLGTGG